MGPARLIPASPPSPPLPSAGPSSRLPHHCRSHPGRYLFALARGAPAMARPTLAGQHPFPYASGDPLSGRHWRRPRPPARELCLPRRDTPPELASGPNLDHNI